MGVFFGVILILLGGFSNGSFYLPFKKVKNWSWEIYWFIYALIALIFAPWIVSFLSVPDLLGLFREATAKSMLWPVVFGALWGVGGLTFGLSMRYLGMGLGMSLALGLTAAFGTLIPPVFKGEFGELLSQTSGIVTLIGVLVCLVGIGITGWAGMSKDNEMPEEKKKEAIKEFDFKKGVLVALFAGLLSASFAFGVEAGKPLAQLATERGTPSLNQNNPILILVMFGGFIINGFWCIYLGFKNRTLGDFGKKEAPLSGNYLFSSTAGILWYLQMMFFGMGKTRMGELDFASWSILMASSIVFSNMWGLITQEWKGASSKTMRILYFGLIVLILSTIIIGYGTYLKQG